MKQEQLKLNGKKPLPNMLRNDLLDYVSQILLL